MSQRDTCHGCDGKGWVLVVTIERTMPFINHDKRNVQPPGTMVTTREFAAATCIICNGDGTVSRKHATIGDAVDISQHVRQEA